MATLHQKASSSDLLRRGFQQLHSHAAAVASITRQWQDLESHLDFIEASLAKRFCDLESREKELENRLKGFESKENQNNLVKLCMEQRFRDLELRRKQQIGDLLPLKGENERVGDANSSADIRFFVTLDSKSLQVFLKEHLDEHEAMREDMCAALEMSVEPAKLVLDAMEGFYSENGDVGSVRRSCVFLLELLMKVSPWISPSVREEATRLACEWKRKMRLEEDESASLEVLGFLQLVASYKLVSIYNVDEIAALHDIVAKHKKNPGLSSALGMVDKRPGNTQMTSGDVSTIVNPHPDLVSACYSSGGRLRVFLIEHNEALESMRDEVYVALRHAHDPTNLVLSALQDFDEPYMKLAEGFESEVNKKVCLLLLEQLMRVSPKLEPYVKRRALTFAADFKKRLDEHRTPEKVLVYLLVLSTFRLSTFNISPYDIFEYLEVIMEYKQAPDICQALLADKIPEFIQYLIKQNQHIKAVRCICVFDMVEEFPPVPLLNTYMLCCETLVKETLSKGQNSSSAKKEAAEAALVCLKSVSKCVAEYNIELGLSLEFFEERIMQIEKVNTCASKHYFAAPESESQARSGNKHLRITTSAEDDSISNIHPTQPCTQHPLAISIGQGGSKSVVSIDADGLKSSASELAGSTNAICSTSAAAAEFRSGTAVTDRSSRGAQYDIEDSAIGNVGYSQHPLTDSENQNLRHRKDVSIYGQSNKSCCTLGTEEKGSENSQLVSTMDPAIVSQSEIASLCTLMDGNGLRIYLNRHVKEHNIMRDEVFAALQVIPDPAKLVLDALQGLHMDKSKLVDGYKAKINNKSCFLLLYQLLRISPKIEPRVKKEALDFAATLKIDLGSSKDPVKIFIFFLMVCIYGLESSLKLQEHEIFELLESILLWRRTPDICRALLADRTFEFINYLIKHNRRIEAIRYIYEFELLDKFPPVALLNDHLVFCKVPPCVENQVASAELDAAIDKEIIGLKAVIKCIAENNIEFEGSPELFEERIMQLEIVKASRKRPAQFPAPGSLWEMQRNKQSRLINSAASPSSSSVMISNSPSTLPCFQHPEGQGVPSSSGSLAFDGSEGSIAVLLHADSIPTAYGVTASTFTSSSNQVAEQSGFGITGSQTIEQNQELLAEHASASKITCTGIASHTPLNPDATREPVQYNYGNANNVVKCQDQYSESMKHEYSDHVNFTVHSTSTTSQADVLYGSGFGGNANTCKTPHPQKSETTNIAASSSCVSSSAVQPDFRTNLAPVQDGPDVGSYIRTWQNQFPQTGEQVDAALQNDSVFPGNAGTSRKPHAGVAEIAYAGSVTQSSNTIAKQYGTGLAGQTGMLQNQNHQNAQPGHAISSVSSGLAPAFPPTQPQPAQLPGLPVCQGDSYTSSSVGTSNLSSARAYGLNASTPPALKTAASMLHGPTSQPGLCYSYQGLHSNPSAGQLVRPTELPAPSSAALSFGWSTPAGSGDAAQSTIVGVNSTLHSTQYFVSQPPAGFASCQVSRHPPQSNISYNSTCSVSSVPHSHSEAGSWELAGPTNPAPTSSVSMPSQRPVTTGLPDAGPSNLLGVYSTTCSIQRAPEHPLCFTAGEGTMSTSSAPIPYQQEMRSTLVPHGQEMSSAYFPNSPCPYNVNMGQYPVSGQELSTPWPHRPPPVPYHPQEDMMRRPSLRPQNRPWLS